MLDDTDRGHFGGGRGVPLSMACFPCALVMLPAVCLILVCLGLLGSMNDMMLLMNDFVKNDDV